MTTPRTTRSDQPGARRRPRAAIALLLAALTFTAGLAALGQPAAAEASTETDFFNRTNAARAAAGLPAMAFDSAAASVARNWAANMAAQGSPDHNPNLAAEVDAWVTNQWSRLGENVGVGGSVESIHQAFMNSTGHRANILGDYNRVGVGTVLANGRIWVTLVFIKGPAISSTPPPPPANNPIGQLDALYASGSNLTVQGWALDRDTAAPIEIHVLINGRLAGYSYANTSRPDVGNAYPGYGNNHGFSFTTPASGGTNTVCVYAINVGGGTNANLGCRSITVSTNPVGRLDGIWIGPGRAVVGGWSFDPQTTAPIEIHVLVDGRLAGYGYANLSRTDVGAAYPGYGSNHGFDFPFNIDGGRHQVCVYGINIGMGINTELGCQYFDVPASPVGQLDGLTARNGSIVVDGWALDPQTVNPIEVHVLVDGRFVGFGYAAYNRPDIAAAFPAYGGGHGFAFMTPAVRGTHQVCIYGINVGAGINTLLGCRTISM